MNLSALKLYKNILLFKDKIIQNRHQNALVFINPPTDKHLKKLLPQQTRLTDLFTHTTTSLRLDNWKFFSSPKTR